MKQITRQEKDIIEKNCWDHYYRSEGCKAISSTSKSHPRAKTYYTIDILAFKAWEALGRTIDDEDYKA